jgi:hypothetical protein
MTTTITRSQTALHGPSTTPVGRRLRLGRYVAAIVASVVSVAGLSSPAQAFSDSAGGSGSADSTSILGSSMSWGGTTLLAGVLLAAVALAAVFVARRVSRDRKVGQPVSLGV